MHLKSVSNAEAADALRARWTQFIANISTDKSSDSDVLKWSADVSLVNYYMMGRYLKFSRDISQTPWMLSQDECDDAGGTVANADDDDDDNLASSCAEAEVEDAVRGGGGGDGVSMKGRGSVEEVIAHAVKSSALRPLTCRMHGCGREDIDVRMLGTGRPFVLEVVAAHAFPSLCSVTANSLCQQIERTVNEGSDEADVAIVPGSMRLADRSLWETMQKFAEEKKKVYRCVVWCEKSLVDDSAALEHRLQQFCDRSHHQSRHRNDNASACASASAQEMDEDGVQCIVLSQRTPLRVLHRRSLIDRRRYVYDLIYERLNAHYFVLTLTTSAGTYVKEFVHGDLGRTSPSIASVLGCAADILQLDVIGLMDEFAGGLLGSKTYDLQPLSVHDSLRVMRTQCS